MYLFDSYYLDKEGGYDKNYNNLNSYDYSKG